LGPIRITTKTGPTTAGSPSARRDSSE
jgi:hypothetical protein